jgi:hypothetical protein
LSSESTPQANWDALKSDLKKWIRTQGRRLANQRSTKLRDLQQQRIDILQRNLSNDRRLEQLSTIDPHIHQLQQDSVDIAALKAGISWREKGETSPGYLKRLHHQRTLEQFINDLSSTDTRDFTTMPTSTLDIAHGFYQRLYSVDPVPKVNISQYLEHIPRSSMLSDHQRSLLSNQITEDEIQVHVSRTTKASSPGADGLGYPYLAHLYRHPRIKPLMTKVYQDALAQGWHPDSWQDIRVRLLPKKGNLSDLKNWRPISLINCDAKVFTRILTSRMGQTMGNCINSHQTGFLPGRFIAENGLALKLIMEQSAVQGLTGVGLLLDQEKAYDRIHPGYMEQVLAHFGFPHGLIQSICGLFFGNSVRINVNGYYTEAVHQKRGLRQGDPLSPLLFNLALEPLLLSILQDPSYQGYVPMHADTTPSRQPVKLLAYADDICLFLGHHDDYTLAMTHFQNYSQVSNAKLNIDKTEAFSLGGAGLPTWRAFLELHGVRKWYDKKSVAPIRYLGFHMVQSPAQRHYVNDRILQQITNACNLFSQRQLSLRGRVMVANSLILSKLWYQLRVIAPPLSFFGKLRSLIYQFVTKRFNPRIGYSTMCLPRQRGGLGLLDARTQSMILQFRWLEMILDGGPRPGFCHSLLHHHLSLVPDNSLGPRLPCFFKSLRRGPLCDHLSFLRRIFDAFDGFAWNPDTSQLSPATWLRLPMTAAITRSHDEYWTHGAHSSDSINVYFCFDQGVGCLRPLIPHHLTSTGPPDTIPHRNLSARLLRDILQRSAALSPSFAHNMTTWDRSLGIIDDSPLINAFLATDNWKHFQAKVHRQRLLTSLPPSRPPPTLSPAKWKRFWTTDMHLICRTLWYRLLIGKLYCADTLSRSSSARPPGCQFCPSVSESLGHLFVSCPAKWSVWLQTFSFFLPSVSLSHSLATSWILDLSIPDTTTWMICSCLLQAIWRQHWAHIIHQHPFSPSIIISTVISQFSLLRPPPWVYYIDH